MAFLLSQPRGRLMSRLRRLRASIVLCIIIPVLATGCAGAMNSPGQAALLCGAGGAAAGAAIGGAASRHWSGALIGAAAGALAAGLSCFAIAEYKSQQVRDYGQTQQATGYQAAQGDSLQITQYEVTPGAAAPGSSVAFNATYTVMTPNPDADVVVTEVRSLSVYDASTNNWRELGRVPSEVTVKPGTRQADGKFEVRSGVAEGQYRVAFQVLKGTAGDSKVLPLVVTRNQATLNSPEMRTAQETTPGGKPLAPDGASSVPTPAAGPADAGASKVPGPAGAPPSTLATLGESQPQAPAVGGAKVAAAAPRVTYFLASKVVGTGTLRGGPGPSYPMVGSISAGERYPIVEAVRQSGNPWFKIRLDTGAEAWVAGALGVEVDK